jgi:hypothetical protein
MVVPVDVPDGGFFARSCEIAEVAVTKNTMAGKSISVLDNIRYLFVITTSHVGKYAKRGLRSD